MKCIFFFLVAILSVSFGCQFNGKNRIRFVPMKHDAEAGQLWRPDGGEKEEDASVITDPLDAGDFEPQTLEACQNSCYSMYGEDCNSHETCGNMNDCMVVCEEKFSSRDAGTIECSNSCYARFGCHGDETCEKLLVNCLLDCDKDFSPDTE
jgi:hypothetical protein